MRVVVISLEAWDEVWRRNQHLVRGLLDEGLAESVLFVEPPVLRGQELVRPVWPGVTALRPRLRVPKRVGGLRLAARALRRRIAGDVDVLWVNDPSFGVHLLPLGLPALYDVTDDWRTFDFPPRIRRRLVRAEDRLATHTQTVVCSAVLRDRWHDRYGIDAPVIRNGVDVDAFASASAVELPRPGKHVGYVGTLHSRRLDLALVLELADRLLGLGSLHLLGPDCLDPSARAELAQRENIVLTGPVPATEVPGLLLAMDVLVAPHDVNPFTLSLDAIKAYEYLAAERPIVATPTSGFQDLAEQAGVHVVPRGHFAARVLDALAHPDQPRAPDDIAWRSRAREFGAALSGLTTAPPSPRAVLR